MKYNYGTSGFRFHHSIIVEIAKKIGKIVALLSSYNKKVYGIMITASHNPCEDNGVKIINYNGEMIPLAEEKTIEEYVNSKDESSESCFFELKSLIPTIPEISIGYDTRESSPEIGKLIVEGIREYHKESMIHNFNLVTTPELHYNLYNHGKKGSLSYINMISKLSEKIKFPIICDCANGIGAYALQQVKEKNESLKLQLTNTNYDNHQLLNHCSGSDYVVNEKKIPTSDEIYPSKLYASLDGDADRIVFYYPTSLTNISLLNGDKISALIAYYIADKISNIENVAVIHTGYSNGAFIKFINKLGIKTICTATGVKNLHHEALKYDISIYFESNGHGTVLFNESYDELKELEEFFHPTIGDGIMDMFAILFILQETKMSIGQWNELYTDNPYELFKMKVFNKSDFVTTENELQLIKPEECQEYIDTICDKDTRAFIRPSGTENYIRIYVESKQKDMVEIVSTMLKNTIENHHMEEEFTIKKTIFQIVSLKKQDFYSHYFYLLQQLTTIDPTTITQKDFYNFVDNLNENHIIKIIKIKHSKKIVGTITILKETKLIHNFGKVAHIEDVIVDKSMQGYGLGKKLLEIAKRESTDCYKIILDCSSENVGFYKKCGFEWKGNQLALYN